MALLNTRKHRRPREGRPARITVKEGLPNNKPKAPTLPSKATHQAPTELPRASPPRPTRLLSPMAVCILEPLVSPFADPVLHSTDRGMLGVGVGAVAVGGLGYAAYSAYQSNQGGKMFGGAHQGVGAGGATDPNYLLNILRQTVQEQVRRRPFVLRARTQAWELTLDADTHQKIGAFYPQGSLEPIAQRVAREGSLQKIAQAWQLPAEAAIDLVRLALFDVVLYLDDSGSMRDSITVLGETRE